MSSTDVKCHGDDPKSKNDVLKQMLKKIQERYCVIAKIDAYEECIRIITNEVIGVEDGNDIMSLKVKALSTAERLQYDIKQLQEQLDSYGA